MRSISGGSLEQAFGRSSAWSVGVEEELMLIDEQTYDLVPAASRVLDGAPAGLKRELFASVVETVTGICASAQEAAARLVELRREAARRAQPVGLRLLAAGSHPFSRPEEQPITDDPYYLEFVRFAGPVARRQGVNGLHVHVGMPDGDTCVDALENSLPWLPVVLALSANSPWFRGEETGFVSARAEVLAALPRSGAPPVLGSYADWEALTERWIDSGLISRYTQVWWDVRVHPLFGTLEVRMPDQPTDERLAGALVALLQALAVWAARTERRTASRADYQTNRFAAARFGPRAELLHPDDDRLVPAAELAAELLDRVRPVAEELGSLELLEALEPERCEAELQLAAGEPRAAAADLADRTENRVRD